MDSFPYGTLKSQDPEELFIMIYLLIDHFLQQRHSIFGPLRHSGEAPKFTDAEVMTSNLVGELLQPISERAWYYQLSTTYKSLFPNLLERSRLLRRKIQLAPLLEEFRRWLLILIGAGQNGERFLDSKPIVLSLYKRARTNQNKRFRPTWLRDIYAELKMQVEPGMGDIGYCASKEEHYFGMKLHLLIDFKGVPMAWELTPASIDDRSVVEEIIPLDPTVQKGGRIRVWTDNGYESEDLKEEVEEKGNALNAFPKKKDYLKWPKWLRHWIRSERQKVETKFSEGKRFVNLETPKAATTGGLMARMTAKITVLTLYMFSGVLSLIAQSQF